MDATGSKLATGRLRARISILRTPSTIWTAGRFRQVPQEFRLILVRSLTEAIRPPADFAVPSWRRVYGLALPAAGSALFNTLFSINDFLWARLIGPEATSALGLVVMVTIFNAGLMALVQKGTLSIVARLRGMEDQQGLRRAALQGVLLSLGLGLVLGALGMLFSPRLLAAMGGQGETLRLGSEYLRRIYAGFPLMSLAMVSDGIFIGMGDTRTPFRLQLGGVFLNASLSALSILVFGAGIRGIALASVFTRGVVGGAGMFLLGGRLNPRPARVGDSWAARLRHRLPGRGQWRLEPGLWAEILRVGLPVAASVSFYSGIFMALNRVLSQFGQQAFGVIGIGIRGNESIGFMVLVGFGAAASALTGEAMGRDSLRSEALQPSLLGRHLRAWVLRVLLAALPLALAFSVLWTLVPERLCAIYTDDPELIRLSAMYLRLAAVANLFQILELILSEGMTGAGISSYPLWITVPGNLARIPLAYFLVANTNWGINAVWAAILISCVLKGTGMLLLFLGADWPGNAAKRTRELGRRVAASRG